MSKTHTKQGAAGDSADVMKETPAKTIGWPIPGLLQGPTAEGTAYSVTSG